MSNKISPKKQIKVYAKTNFKCAYCGKELDFNNNNPKGMEYGIDHIIPKSKGGTNDLSNLLGCCRSCNSSKKANTLEWFRFKETLKRSNIPAFTEEQIEFLKTKIDIEKLFPKSIKFYFEQI